MDAEVRARAELEQVLDFLVRLGAAKGFVEVGQHQFRHTKASVTACAVQPDELIVPYVRQPEEIVPGKPLFFATAASLGGVATGLLVESHEGRPTKIEGNPDHPASQGGTDLFAQASILSLYDPV